VQINEMDKGLKNLAAAAQISGSSFGEMMPVYAMALTSYRDAASASIALRTAMARMVDPKIQGQLERIGVTVQGAGGQMLPVQEVFLSLADAATKNKDNWMGFQQVLDKVSQKWDIHHIQMGPCNAYGHRQSWKPLGEGYHEIGRDDSPVAKVKKRWCNVRLPLVVCVVATSKQPWRSSGLPCYVKPLTNNTAALVA
jgi:hypothetical protein